MTDQRPADQTFGRVRLSSTMPEWVEAFEWARAQAIEYVFPAHETGDPVGDWYEAALPGRAAFCMRDVSHQALGAHVLGLERFTLNMMRKFVRAISPSRDYCGYWEIDRLDRPAPVDYVDDTSFWYNLPANFDVMRACWEQYLWSGRAEYVSDRDFLRFYDLSANQYIERWDRNGDGIPDHRSADGTRGLGGYDEADTSNFAASGADLVALQYAALHAYAAVLRRRNDAAGAERMAARAEAVKASFRSHWWSPERGIFATMLLEDGSFSFEHVSMLSAFPARFGLVDAEHRARILDQLEARPTECIECESYVPEVLFEGGRPAQAMARLLALCRPDTPRREYPEVSFAVVGQFAAGLMGIRPDARDRSVATASGLPTDGEEALLEHVPVFGSTIAVGHAGSWESTLANTGADPLTWRASIGGTHPRLLVDGSPTAPEQAPDANGRPWSTVVVRVDAGQRRSVRAATPAWAAGSSVL